MTKIKFVHEGVNLGCSYKLCFCVHLKYKRNRIKRRLLLFQKQSSPQQKGSAVFHVSTINRCKYPRYTMGFNLPHGYKYAQGPERDLLRSASDHNIVCFC